MQLAKFSVIREYVVLVDEEFLDFVSKYSWTISGAGYVSTKIRNVDQKIEMIYLHNIILTSVDGKEPDHINGNKLDNRKINLRLSSRKENCQNRPKMNSEKRDLSSKYKGVSKTSKGRKWRARISVDGIPTLIGYFDDEIDAARAYNEAALRHHKKYAKLNENIPTAFEKLVFKEIIEKK